MNERAHCPYLGLRQNRAIRFASPTAEHRCYVAGDAQEIPVDQRAYCLSGEHRTCPLYTGEWGATTSGAVGAGGVLALTRLQRARSRGRDTLFYLLVSGLVLTITAVWLGIGYLYAMGNTGAPAAVPSAPVRIVFPTATAEPTATLEPTPTATVVELPPAPQGPTAVLGSDRVILDWQPGPPPRTRGYRIQRSDKERGPWFQLNAGLHTYSKYEDSGLEPNTQYYYRIITVDRDGLESEATVIRVRTLASSPTPTPTSTPTPSPTLEPTPPQVAPIYIPPPAVTPVPPTFTPQPEPPTPAPEPTPEPAPPTDPTPEPSPPVEATPEPPTPEPTPEVPTPEPSTPEPPTPEPSTPEPTVEVLPTPETTPPTPEPPTPQP